MTGIWRYYSWEWGEFLETKAPLSIGTCHPCLQCRGFGKGSENFLNVCHVCTILLSEAHDCQLAAECAHLHCDDEASQASWVTEVGLASDLKPNKAVWGSCMHAAISILLSLSLHSSLHIGSVGSENWGFAKQAESRITGHKL